MANIGNISNWDKIQKGVKDTEGLIGRKKYNLAMVRSRQTLELMVRCMGERACVVDGDLAETIDQLFQGRWISKTSCEHYHKIRMIGNRAVHEGNDNAYEANQAFQLLSKEVYTFANDYSNNSRPKRPSSSNAGRTSNRTINRGRKRTRQKKGGLSVPDLLKILIPVLCVIILILFFWLKPEKEKPVETTEAPTTEATTAAPTEETPTEAPTTAAPLTYKTSDTLNVRGEASTNGTKLGVLAPGTSVTYIRKHDDFWSVISFNGKEGYVATQYLIAE